MKIALVQVVESAVALGYGDDGYTESRYFDCLDFQEVSDQEYREYVEAVKIYNLSHSGKGLSLAIITQKDCDTLRVSIFEDLKKYRQREVKRRQDAEKAEALRKQQAAEKRLAAKMKRTAKDLGVSVEALMALQTKTS